ncbi:MAG: XRE family transcriptional regulator [Thermodesulfobacteriota bacterium]
MEQAYKEIGPRLRGLREAMGLGPSAMAERLGVSLETLERYESGAVEIPVSFVAAAAKAGRVDLTVLLSGGEARLHDHCLVRKGQGLSVERRKDYDYRNLAYTFTGRKMEPFLIRVPAKEEADVSFTQHPGQEFVYMLEGRLEITLGGKKLALEPGDSLYFDASNPHALRGLDGRDALFLDVIL